MSRLLGRRAAPARPARRSAARPPRGPGQSRRVFSASRLIGLLITVVSGAGIAWLLSAGQFSVAAESVEMSGLHYTDPATVEAAIGLSEAGRTNIFRIPAERIQQSLAALPAVARADVRVVLPNRLVVTLVERAPVFIVLRPEGDFLLDAEGVVLERLPAGGAPAGLPVIEDRRAATATDVSLGERIDGVEATAMLELGALTPALIGSAAASLFLSIDDRDGYVISAQPGGWRAVFGHYTSTLRPPDIIGRQVDCLRSILAQDEQSISTIYLAPLDERCGTFLPVETPREFPAPASPA